MKNYKKIYQKLIKEIKRLRQGELNYKAHEDNPIMELVSKQESQYAITTMDVILEMSDEISGKQCHLSIMNSKQFNQWKKKINT